MAFRSHSQKASTIVPLLQTLTDKIVAAAVCELEAGGARISCGRDAPPAALSWCLLPNRKRVICCSCSRLFRGEESADQPQIRGYPKQAE